MPLYSFRELTAKAARAILAPAALFLITAPAQAQYFGQNRVQYSHFDFKVIRTTHFDVHYYGRLEHAATAAARMSERSYNQLSRFLGHRYRERQPIILFGSHSEFQQNNVLDIGEGTAGVTDALRHRMMLPFTGSMPDFEHVLKHEMTHQFQFDVFAGGAVGGALSRLMTIQPPLWFMEGMAEYMAVGPATPLTEVWLRDAVLNGTLPSISEMSANSGIFPYRFGHSLFAYIGDRWGRDAVGNILHAVAATGMESGFARALGITLDRLNDDWQHFVYDKYSGLDETLDQPDDFARPLLNPANSSGRVHVSPALSPDGKQVVYLSEGKSLFVDLYLADGETGQVKRRLIKSAFSADFESLRFINSAGSWSPDGRYFAIAVKHGGRDDIVILDMESYDTVRRIRIGVSGISNPSWSPDGTQLVFTGYDAGSSDLFLISADGSNLRRLTNDFYADLEPAWSPDGRTIAFATDRGPDTDPANLEFRKPGIALLTLETGRITRLPDMQGTNINPVWSPDGEAIAYVSDRSGIPNIYLYEIASGRSFQLTNVLAGVTGITALSPSISWARRADRLAFTYFEDGRGTGAWNVYTLDNPRAIAADPFHRLQAQAGLPPATTHTRTHGAALEKGPISVRELLEVGLNTLPDSTGFEYTRYAGTLHPDYVVQPSIGYVRDNFGGGVFGGTAVSLSDLLGNRHLLFGMQLNGRLAEAQVTAVYSNQSRRINWSAGYSQEPVFYFAGSRVTSVDANTLSFDVRYRRLVVRQAFWRARRPFSRFSRLEFGLRAVNIGRADISFQQFIDPASNLVFDTDVDIDGLGGTNYFQPALALVFDNTVSLFVGPFQGRRSRFEYAPAVGGWQFHQVLGDYRRYDPLPGRITLASRFVFFGRFGRDSDEFPMFLGTPELLRGHTSGSYRRHECRIRDADSFTGCRALDELVGSRVAVAGVELRFPLMDPVGFGFFKSGLPPLEAALFFDSGVAWNAGDRLAFSDDSGGSSVREPLMSTGVSLRSNIYGVVLLRADYTKPLRRRGVAPYWTLSIGPTF